MGDTLPDWSVLTPAPPTPDPYAITVPAPTPLRGTPRTQAYARSASSPVRLLAQNFGLEKNPYDNFRKLQEVGESWGTVVNEATGVDAVDRQRLLAWGVSSEGEGRAAYLRTSYARLPSTRGNLVPETNAQVYGYYAYRDTIGKPMKLYPAIPTKQAVKHFFARSSHHGLRRPDLGNRKDDAVPSVRVG